MTNSHTPAPWVLTIRQGGEDATITVAELFPQGKYRGGIARLQSAEHIDGIGREELIANAHLLAAAPDMLEALKALLNGVTQHGMMADHGPALREQARVAIAKAEGQS
jgi:hypothetical protein